MTLTLRFSRSAACGLAALVAVTACGSNSTKTKTASSTTGPIATVASKLILGGPAECQTNAFCLPGLSKTYNITFASFKVLDADGPLTYAALGSGDIQVGEVFSTDGLIADKGLIVLQDDKHLQAADNVVPVIRKDKATPAVSALVNKVSQLITTDGLTTMNKKVTVDKSDPADVATQFLKDNGLDAKSTSAAGTSLKIASFNFGESVLLADIYGKALQAAGASVTFKNNLGSRQTVEPGLESGQIDFVPEYAASALEFVDKKAGLANGDTTNNVTKLADQFAPMSISVLDPSPAIDTNAFAVTKATADKYHLVTMSDLAKPAT